MDTNFVSLPVKYKNQSLLDYVDRKPRDLSKLWKNTASINMTNKLKLQRIVNQSLDYKPYAAQNAMSKVSSDESI